MSKNLPPGTMPEVEGNPLPTIAQDLFGDGTMLVVPLPGHTIVLMGLLGRGQRVGLEIGDWCLFAGDAAWSSDAYRTLSPTSRLTKRIHAYVYHAGIPIC